MIIIMNYSDYRQADRRKEAHTYYYRYSYIILEAKKY